MSEQIGWLIVGENEKRTLRYEYAAWYKELILDVGRFPIYAIIVESKVVDTSLIASVEGTVLGDDFSPAWGGVAFASKRNELIGQRDTWFYRPYAHALAHGLISGDVKNVELLDGFKAKEVSFVSYDERTLFSYSIVADTK
jgi:hypothetical protein